MTWRLLGVALSVALVLSTWVVVVANLITGRRSR